MTQNTRQPAAPEAVEPKKKFSLSVPRTVVTHLASFLAGAAAYAGAQKLREDVNLDATLTAGEHTVIDV